MFKRYLISITLIAVFAICVGFLHFLIIQHVNTFFTVFQIYLFNFSVSTFSILVLFLINQQFKDKVGFVFMALGILKMMVTVYFLMPLINSNFENKIPDVLQFFFCYFLFLALESIITVKQLNKN